jgi:hypothetical protein
LTKTNSGISYVIVTILSWISSCHQGQTIEYIWVLKFELNIVAKKFRLMACFYPFE